MAGSEPTTFRLQGECSSQAELHWHVYNERFEALKCYLSTAKTPLHARSFAHSKMGLLAVVTLRKKRHYRPDHFLIVML